MNLEEEDVELPGDEDAGIGTDSFAALDKLYRMGSIKKDLTKLKSTFDLAEKEGEALPDLGHFVFVGAPGTGKTTVARLMAKMLCRSGMLARPDVVETTGLELTGEATGQTKKKVLGKLAEAKGGVLFIDEAYELGKGTYGSEACSALVGAMTNDKYKGMCIILAGYQSDIQSMLDTNPGLKSKCTRFFEFPDWNAMDCVDMIKKKTKEGNYNFEKLEESCKLLEKGFSKLSQLKGFGNARDVDKVFMSLLQQRAERLAIAKKQDDASANGGRVFCLKDVKITMDTTVNARMGSIGAPRDEAKLSTVDPFAPLDKLHRLDAIKEKLKELKSTMKLAISEEDEKPDLGHFIFYGAPGTGKTTVARAMADILFSLGLIPPNNLIETTGQDLTGEFAGQTKKKTQDELDKAKGGVLFIDEAYELGKSQYGAEAVTTLVAAMTAPEYAGLTVIIAGYHADIRKMLEVNVGFASRFKHSFDFPDWHESDCADLFQKLSSVKKFQIGRDGTSWQAVKNRVLLPGFKRLIPLKGWGNARCVNKLWESTYAMRASRLSGKKPKNDERIVLLEDAKSAMDQMVAARLGASSSSSVQANCDPFAPLDRLYCMDSVKQKLKQLRSPFLVADLDGEDQPPLGHFIFLGSPGTGKTTVARVMASVLFNLGLIGRDHVEETSGLKMTGEYLGQTKVVVEDQLEKAKGGLLFIDEAYTLGKGQYGTEACDTLVAAMTDPKYAGVVIVIAGYPADIDEMLTRNQGLKSRFTHTIEFPNWTAEDCFRFFKGKMKKMLQEDVTNLANCENKSTEIDFTLRKGFNELVLLPDWANARDVEAVWEASKRYRADRIVEQKFLDSTHTGARNFVVSDISRALEEMVKSKQKVKGSNCSPKSLQEEYTALAKQEHPLVKDPPVVAAPPVQAPLHSVEEDQCTRTTPFPMAVQDTQGQLESKQLGDHLLDKGERLSVKELPTAVASPLDEAPLHSAEENEWLAIASAEEDQLETKELGDHPLGPGDGVQAATRDHGVSDQVWFELQQAIEQEKRVKAQLQAEEAERKRLEAEIAADLEAKRIAKEAYEKKMRELARAREEAEKRQREAQKNQEKLRKIGNCPMGFVWRKCGSGWRCAGGSHFVSDAELHRGFSYDA